MNLFIKEYFFGSGLSCLGMNRLVENDVPTPPCFIPLGMKPTDRIPKGMLSIKYHNMPYHAIFESCFFRICDNFKFPISIFIDYIIPKDF